MMFNACTAPQLLKAIERTFLILAVYCSYMTALIYAFMTAFVYVSGRYVVGHRQLLRKVANRKA